MTNQWSFRGVMPMEFVTIPEPEIDLLRAIARAGFAYAAAKSLCKKAGWRLVDDEPDLDYVRFAKLLAGSDQSLGLSVLIAESKKSPCGFVPLFWFDEYNDTREPLDIAFRSVAQQLTRFLGTATLSGEYRYPHRSGWPYSFVGWSLPDATMVLVQDEFDIQFGMDVTLWVQRAGTAIHVPIEYG